MNPDIDKLYRIAQKPERKIIGLMSGTSLDGLDIALCNCKNAGRDTKVEIQQFVTKAYDSEFKALIKQVFANRDADLEMICLLNEMIAVKHAALIGEALAEWAMSPAEIDLIASHGQTIYHAPRILHKREGYPNATLQIGDGDHLAIKTRIITVSDFRQKHVASGAEGAPLAVYGDYLLFSRRGEDRIMLNIGGISNFTFLPGDEDRAMLFSTDVGPGNTLIDQYVQQHHQGMFYDADAKLARQGRSHEGLLQALQADDFFKMPFPKTTGPELFNLAYLQTAQQYSGTQDLPENDVLATLCHFTAQTVACAVKAVTRTNENPLAIFMSGGGMHNPLLVELLRQELPAAVFDTTAAFAINPDAKEAVLFAVLANETVAGRPIPFSRMSGVPAVCMGKISLPH